MLTENEALARRRRLYLRDKLANACVLLEWGKHMRENRAAARQKRGSRGRQGSQQSRRETGSKWQSLSNFYASLSLFPFSNSNPPYYLHSNHPVNYTLPIPPHCSHFETNTISKRMTEGLEEWDVLGVWREEEDKGNTRQTHPPTDGLTAMRPAHSPTDAPIAMGQAHPSTDMLTAMRQAHPPNDAPTAMRQAHLSIDAPTATRQAHPPTDVHMLLWIDT